MPAQGENDKKTMQMNVFGVWKHPTTRIPAEFWDARKSTQCKIFIFLRMHAFHASSVISVLEKIRFCIAGSLFWGAGFCCFCAAQQVHFESPAGAVFIRGENQLRELYHFSVDTTVRTSNALPSSCVFRSFSSGYQQQVLCNNSIIL